MHRAERQTAFLLYAVICNGSGSFSLDRLIEAGDGSFLIRHDINDLQNTEGQDGKQIPPDKAQVKDKQIPFMTVHHLVALGDRLRRGIFGVVVQNMEGHRARKLLDDTGDIIILLYYKNLERKNVAEMLGMTYGQLRYLHDKALRRLDELLCIH